MSEEGRGTSARSATADREIVPPDGSCCCTSGLSSTTAPDHVPQSAPTSTHPSARGVDLWTRSVSLTMRGRRAGPPPGGPAPVSQCWSTVSCAL